ncbi:MAG: DUF433 domain-containing protein [Bacillota bacterium]
MAWQDLLEVNPAVVKGKPVIRGTRVPVHLVVGKLAKSPLLMRSPRDR